MIPIAVLGAGRKNRRSAISYIDIECRKQLLLLKKVLTAEKPLAKRTRGRSLLQHSKSKSN
jgi:hypothetical protein